VTSGGPSPRGERPGRAQLDTLKHWQMGLTPDRKVIENGACMKASLQIAGLDGDTKLVTNSVTKSAGEPRAMQGNCHQFCYQTEGNPGQ
jgi:hypothetical protein